MKYKGEIKDFPHEVVKKMLERQVEQGNQCDSSVFKTMKRSEYRGFTWESLQKDMIFGIK